MQEGVQTISDRIQSKLDDLTRAERQLALSILENYPASGLGPLAALAKDAHVSVPTVARMVQKLGYKGYPDFQAELREELRAKAKGPIAKHETWAEAAPSGHILNRFTDAVIGNIRHTLGHIDPDAFDQACKLVADPGLPRSEEDVLDAGRRMRQFNTSPGIDPIADLDAHAADAKLESPHCRSDGVVGETKVRIEI